jgi:hypothetical protein
VASVAEPEPYELVTFCRSGIGTVI